MVNRSIAKGVGVRRSYMETKLLSAVLTDAGRGEASGPGEGHPGTCSALPFVGWDIDVEPPGAVARLRVGLGVFIVP